MSDTASKTGHKH